jgi:hypothetical protein
VLLGKRRQFDVKWRSIPLGDIGGRCNPSLIDATAKLSNGRSYGANKLFPNCGGRVANPFDCARQLIFGNAKMPGPIFNMVLMLDNDFAAVRSCFTDHLFCAPGYAESKQGRVGFVPLDGLDGAIDRRKNTRVDDSCIISAAAHESAIGTKRTSRSRSVMSAFGGQADLARTPSNVRFWHKADIPAAVNVRF